MGWWIVVLPGEYTETSEAYGPFRSEGKAEAVAEHWNTDHGSAEDRAFVLAILPPNQIRSA